jgi:predicted Zn finger-like uncharacterized protein
MALATRCPHCQTTFRVAHDQLKLRAGLVRCGACKEIFNGIEHLLPASVPAQTSGPQDSAAVHAATVSPALHQDAVHIAGQQAAATSRYSASPAPDKQVDEDRSVNIPTDHSTAATAVGTDANEDPLLRMTLMDFSAWKEDEASPSREENPEETPHSKAVHPVAYSDAEQPADAPDALDRAIEDLQRKPWRRKNSQRSSDDDIDEDVAEPDFVRRARRQQRIGRTLHVLMSVGSLILLVAFIAQAAYTFRNQIAAWLPQTAPILAQACTFIGCHVGFPARIDAVSVESSELQTLAPNQNAFVLNALLRNRSSTAQAWPSIELTLNDANEKVIARRVFSPGEYLVSANDLKKGFAANSEQSVKVFFELLELKASGFRVYLFYP